MNDVVIKEAITKQDWKIFLRLPWTIYRDDPYWVPPLLSEQKKILNREKNPFFKHAQFKAWIVLKSEVPVGRILSYIDSDHNIYYKEQAGFIGFFECIDHQETADALFSVATTWLIDKGMESVCGPMNFSIGNECGVQLDGYMTMPYLQMNHTQPYYTSLFENAGYSKSHDLYAYKLIVEETLCNQIFQTIKNITEKVMQRNNITFRPVNMNNYILELERINTIFNNAMHNNWGFVPSSMDEVIFMADGLKMIVDPEMILLAEYEGKVVGCSVTLPDVNQVLKHLNGKLFPLGWIKFLYYKPKIDRLRMYLLGIVEDRRLRGLDAAFYYLSILKAYERGYKEAELSWVSEANTTMNSIIEKLGATRYKTYRMYQKKLN